DAAVMSAASAMTILRMSGLLRVVPGFSMRDSQGTRRVLGSQLEKHCMRSLAPRLQVRRRRRRRSAMNKDEMKGKVEQAKGYVKEKVGQATDNPDLEAEGAADRAAGKGQEAVGKARRKVVEAIEEAGDKIKGN